jgi:hypothetical protein
MQSVIEWHPASEPPSAVRPVLIAGKRCTMEGRFLPHSNKWVTVRANPVGFKVLWWSELPEPPYANP